ncbi:MAG: cupredoxin domain-containing protein [Candidatus Andersenbacteria bacterium]
MKSVMVWGALVLILLVVVGGLIVFSGSQPTSEEVDESIVAEEEVGTIPPNSLLESPTTSPLTSPVATVSPSPVTLGTEGTIGTAPVTIAIDDTGFTPATITIPVNTTVTFTNNGQALHWPASDNHPTHEILPEFDSEKGLQTGESYSHTFTKTGTWEFHDHLNPRATGQVTVQ